MKVEIEIERKEESIKCGDCFCIGVNNHIYIRILSSQGVKIFGENEPVKDDIYGISLDHGGIIRANKDHCSKLEQKEPFKLYKNI